VQVRRLGLRDVCRPCGQRAVAACPKAQEPPAVRRRRLKNLRARARYDALRSLGLKRTPYGWE